MNRMRRGFTLLEAVVLLVMVLILAAFLFSIFARMGDKGREGRRASCQSDLKQIGLGFAQYLQDYDKTYPSAGTLSPALDTGWVRKVDLYTKSLTIYKCKTDQFSQDTSPQSTHLTDYYFNRNLADSDEKDLLSSVITILAGEGEAASSNYACRFLNSCIGFNDNGAVGAVPKSAKGRHLDGCNYEFADGHVKWYLPSKISGKPVSAGVPTFAVK